MPSRTKMIRRLGVLAGCVGLGMAWLAAGARAQVPTPWSFAGGDLYDSHAMLSSASAGNPGRIQSGAVRNLALKWSYTTQGDVSATPTVEQGGLYVPDWAGMLYKLDPVTGALIWSNSVSSYTGLPGSVSRTSPAIGGSVIVIGDHTIHPGLPSPGARVIGINKATGALAWSTVVDPGPNSAVDSSPVIYGNTAYVGLTGWDEGLAAANPNFVPSTRNAVIALNVATGAILWKFYTVPQGYTGGSVWGSSPVVWPARNMLLVATGNNYSIPAAATSCLQTAGNGMAAQLSCLDPTNYVDSVLALDLTTGALRWSRRMQGADTWTVACITGLATCPNPRGGDFDFASAPNLTWVPHSLGTVDDRGGTSDGHLLGAGQKSGVYWGLNPVNGGLFWSALVGQGGIQWGSSINADSETSVFVSLENRGHLVNTLAGQHGVPVTWNAGAWGAVSLVTGKLLWQIPAYGNDLVAPTLGATAGAASSFSNDVLFTGSSSGAMVALDANTGFRFWAFNSGGTVITAPAIFNETVYWGTGYAHGGGVSNPKLFAFAIPTH